MYMYSYTLVRERFLCEQTFKNRQHNFRHVCSVFGTNI